MTSKKDILKNKSLHMKALKATIQKYNNVIDGKIILKTNAWDCALCILDSKIGGLCKGCIHTSSFSQGKRCANQKSFQVLNYTSLPRMTDRQLKVRRNYLIIVLNRLKEAQL